MTINKILGIKNNQIILTCFYIQLPNKIYVEYAILENLYTHILLDSKEDLIKLLEPCKCDNLHEDIIVL